MDSQQILAAFGLVACVGALVYGALPARRRWQVRSAWEAMLAKATAMTRAAGRARATRSAGEGRADPAGRGGPPVDPAREAEAVIERARRARPGATREGKVIRPDAFHRPRRPDEPLH